MSFFAIVFLLVDFLLLRILASGLTAWYRIRHIDRFFTSIVTSSKNYPSMFTTCKL